MRYNKHELYALASQTSQNYEREGVLIIKERQDSFFRRSEGCSVRWFRLRGNLLFYLKGPEPWYEPLGVIVLGNHQVSVQIQDENGHWPFQIVWENGVTYRIATFLESERTLWLKAMEVAPYEHMTQRIADLHRQLKDTRTLIDLKNYRITNKIINDFNEVPLCELSLSCDNLLCDANGNPPSPFAATFVLFPERDLCVRYCSTEAVMRCSNPTFSRTVMFRGSDGITSDVLVRIAVYDIRESVTQTGVAMGSVTMRLSHIQEAQRLRVPLLTMDDKTVGFVTLNGWSLEPSHAGASPTHPNVERNSIDLTPKILCHRRSQSLPPRLGLKLKYPSYGMMIRQNFLNPHQATYRFHSGLGGEITVHEAIAEPRFCFTMPLQLVEIYMCREKELLEAMLAFAEVTKRVAPRHLDLLSTHLSVMKLYQAAKKAQDLFNTHLNVMKIYQGAKRMMLKYGHTFFKPSSRKEEADLEFAPVNLHLQRMWVHNDTLNKTGFHDVVTVGAFSAHSHQSDKPGGLIRLVQQSKDTSTQKAEMMANTNRLEAEFEKLNTIKALRNVAVANMDRTLLLMQAGRFTEARNVVEDIKYNVAKILSLWDVNAVEEALSKIGWNKRRIDEEGEAIRLAEQLAMQAQQAVTPEGAAGAAAPEGAAGAPTVKAVASVTIIDSAAAVAALEGVKAVAVLEGTRVNAGTEGAGVAYKSPEAIRIFSVRKGPEPVSGESGPVIDGAGAVAALEDAEAITELKEAEPVSAQGALVIDGAGADAAFEASGANSTLKGPEPVSALKVGPVLHRASIVSALDGNGAIPALKVLDPASAPEVASIIDGAEAFVAVEGTASVSRLKNIEGVSGLKGPELVPTLEDGPIMDGAEIVFALEGAGAVSLPSALSAVASPEVVEDIFTPEVIGVAPLGVAGASAPEGASGIDSYEQPPEYSAVVTSPICIPKMSPALRSALEASAAEGAIAVLSRSNQSISKELPSSSSSDTTPTVQNQLQFQHDHFKKESDSSENNGASGQSDLSGNSKSSAKTAKKKPTRKGKCNRNIQNRIADSNERPSRPGHVKPKPPPVTERQASLKDSKSAEQTAVKPVVNNKKADKKKEKKNRRIVPDRSPPEFVMDPEVRRYNLMFFADVTTAIRDMLFNVDLSVNEISKKESYTEAEFEDSKILMDLLIKLLDETHKWTRMAHTAMRIDSETPMWTLEHATLQSRRDTCFSQALTATAAGLMCWLSSEPGEIVAKIIQSGLGPLCGFEGLLSLYALEKTMWGDMVVAVEDLHTVTFKLVKFTTSIPVIPQVTGRRNAVIVELPVSESLYARFDKFQDKPTFTVTAVFFNIGINEKAAVAAALGECRPQYFSNSDNLERLNKYYHKYTKIFPSDPMEPIRASSRSKPLEEVMENLRAAVAKRAPKDTEVLQLAALATRQMHGIRFTSCKSAKDRTGMAVTLEQTNILSSEYHLADHDRRRALDVMRSEGCRRENALKNIGLSKCAFTKKQVMSLPEEYQPPKGSYGTIQT